jgi:acetyltransferase-like isoleucine patch superfamily enzyme
MHSDFAELMRQSTSDPSQEVDVAAIIEKVGRRIGAGAFLNFNCVILDVVEVTIGDGTQIGPAVQVATSGLAVERSSSPVWS